MKKNLVIPKVKCKSCKHKFMRVINEEWMYCRSSKCPKKYEAIKREVKV